MVVKTKSAHEHRIDNVSSSRARSAWECEIEPVFPLGVYIDGVQSNRRGETTMGVTMVHMLTRAVIVDITALRTVIFMSLLISTQTTTISWNDRDHGNNSRQQTHRSQLNRTMTHTAPTVMLVAVLVINSEV